MNCVEYLKPVLEAYRGSDLAPGSLDVQDKPEGSVIPRSISAVEGKAAEKTPAEREKEEQLELWMNDIKSFIRNIDVGSL